MFFEEEKEAKISPEAGLLMILIEQIRRINRIGSFVSSNGWRKEYLQCYINAIKQLERICIPLIDEQYMNHREKVMEELKKLDIRNVLDRERIFDLWGDLFADLMDLLVRRKQVISRGEIGDEW